MTDTFRLISAVFTRTHRCSTLLSRSVLSMGSKYVVFDIMSNVTKSTVNLIIVEESIAIYVVLRTCLIFVV